jgi:hypothetical protein
MTMEIVKLEQCLPNGESFMDVRITDHSCLGVADFSAYVGGIPIDRDVYERIMTARDGVVAATRAMSNMEKGGCHA